MIKSQKSLYELTPIQSCKESNPRDKKSSAKHEEEVPYGASVELSAETYVADHTQGDELCEAFDGIQDKHPIPDICSIKHLQQMETNDLPNE